MKLSRTNGRGLDRYSTLPRVWCKANPRFARGRETTCTQPARLKICGDDRAAASGAAPRPAESRPDARNPGESSGEATPVPIPNAEVKLSSAEDTERAAFRENRSEEHTSELQSRQYLVCRLL